jgi:hypothetical protein
LIGQTAVGAGAGLRWLSGFGGAGLDVSISNLGYTISPVFDLFTGELAMVYLGGSYIRSSGNDALGLNLGVNLEPRR